MAKKITENKWDKIRIDREIHCLSFSVLAKKYDVGKATIVDRSKKYNWSQEQASKEIS